LQQHQVEVIFEAHQVPAVEALPHQLSQVFLNLVINAVESMPDQGRLQVAIYPVDQEVVISFTSAGPAIPPDILPHIFDPFFTTKAEGSGLGLWICHNLIEQNQGSLTVQNLTEPPGVVFTVRLPLARAEP
jgi:signal transduction histidine kinase